MQNLASALIEYGDLDSAISQAKQILAIQPDHFAAKIVLGRAFKESGRADEAIELYRQADNTRPDPRTLSDLLFTLHLHPAYGPLELLAEHLRWNQRYAVPLRPRRILHSNNPSPNRKLRIGYLAHDLGDNALGRFLLPILANHDRSNFEIVCYCDTRRSDALGEQFARLPHTWRLTRKLSDDLIVQQIRQDQIDIIIDLAMHTHGNHLAALAQKPAPIQMTYLAYCSTTGVETIDYRLTDPHIDPPGLDSTVYSEKSLHLPNTYWCYPEPPFAPEVSPLPATSAGHITFGCLNDFAKLSPISVGAWQNLLHQLPTARLILHCKRGSHRQALIDRFAAAGVESSRIEMISFVPSSEYFALYNRIDVALDPFPWAGGTTTCDSLWMGVPVVTMVGPTAVSRGGKSILNNVGLADLVTNSPANYVRCALTLANDLPRLSKLRASLRTILRKSHVMDAQRFTRDLESLFRNAWQTWCTNQSQSSGVMPPPPESAA